MRLVFFLPFIDQGGGAQVFLRLIRGMIDLDQEVSVITFDRDLEQHLPKKAVVFLISTKGGQRSFGSSFDLVLDVLRIRNAIKTTRPEALIAMWGTAVAYAAWRMSNINGSFVQCAHVSLPRIWGELDVFRRWSRKLSSSIVYRGADLIITPSAGLSEEVRILFDRMHGVTAIPNPIEFQAVGQENNDPYFIKWKKTGNPRFIGAGRLSKVKDFKTLIEAFCIFRKKIGGNLCILGEGDQRDALEEFAVSLGIREHVLFPGYRRDAADWIQASDCFVLSSRHESFGNVVAEALALGVQVVSTDCPYGPSEILSNGEYGFLAPVGNPYKMAACMENAIAHPKNVKETLLRAQDFNTIKVCTQYLLEINAAKCGVERSS